MAETMMAVKCMFSEVCKLFRADSVTCQVGGDYCGQFRKLRDGQNTIHNNI